MILLLIVLSIYLGFNLKFDPVSVLIVSFIFLSFVLFRYRKKLFGLCIITFSLAFLVSNIYVPNNSKIKFGVVIESKENYILFQSTLERFYVYEKNNAYEIGDYLKVEGEVAEIDFEVLESSFDMNTYLKKKGVYREITINKIHNHIRFPFRIKALKNSFVNRFDEKTSLLISSLFFSVGYEGEEIAIMRSLQLNRLISNSGLYLYAISFILDFIIKKFIKHKYRRIIPLIFIFSYQIIVFPRLTVLRFLINQILKFINENVLTNKLDYLSSISISMLLVLMIDYHFIYQDSFLIGYSIPVFLFFTRNIFKRSRWWKIPIISAGALYIFFLPFILKYNNSINLFSPILQVFMTPLLIPFFIFVFICFFGLPIHSFINRYYVLVHNSLSIFKYFSLEIHAPSMPLYSCILLYAILFSFIYYLAIDFSPIYKRIGIIMIIFLPLHFIPFENVYLTSVSFINVGQGDSCLIRKGPTAILIDTGGSLYKDIATECLIPYFKANRIYDIDLVITTHNDLDHNGALPSLIENFKVEKVVSQKSSFPITINGIKIENLNTASYSEDNENSLVLFFKLWDKRFLFMGDASKKIEKQIINEHKDLKCDILKIGHHGSNTSTDKTFISQVQPKEAIVSVGSNFYGHPNKEVLDILSYFKVRVRRTDIEGTIMYKNYKLL